MAELAATFHHTPALTAIDHRLTAATECRRRAAAAAEQAVINGLPQRAAEARHHVSMLTRHIDSLLTNRELLRAHHDLPAP